MTADTLRHWILHGPRDPAEHGTLDGVLGRTLYWRNKVVGAMVVAFLWAVLPYYAQPPATSDILATVSYVYGVGPWLFWRPLRVLAVLPLTLYLFAALTRLPRW